MVAKARPRRSQPGGQRRPGNVYTSPLKKLPASEQRDMYIHPSFEQSLFDRSRLTPLERRALERMDMLKAELRALAK